MCWVTESFTGVKMAENDIRCFKICRYFDNKTALSKYMKMKYELGKEYVLQDKFRTTAKIGGFEIMSSGFHSYALSTKIYESHLQYEDSDFYVMSKSKKPLDSCELWQKMSVYDCIIPKGASYVENEDGELVSDRIIIKRCSKKLF